MFKKLLQQADKNGYAIPAFSFTELIDIKAVLEAAQEEESPVILLANWEPTLWLGFDYLKTIVEVAKKDFSIPILLQLDHGEKLEQILTCIRYGFDVVMIDGSHLPYQENVVLTRKVVEIAHGVGVSVEGEIGKIKGEEAGKVGLRDEFTDPGIAKEFVEATGVDAIAIAFGNQHGYYQTPPQLAFDILEKVDALVSVPIVMHGGTGIPEENIRKAIHLGINKINIGTALKKAYLYTLQREIRTLTHLDLVRILDASKEAVKKTVKTYIRMLGSSKKGLIN